MEQLEIRISLSVFIVIYAYQLQFVGKVSATSDVVDSAIPEPLELRYAAPQTIDFLNDVFSHGDPLKGKFSPRNTVFYREYSGTTEMITNFYLRHGNGTPGYRFPTCAISGSSYSVRQSETWKSFYHRRVTFINPHATVYATDQVSRV